MPEGPLAGLKVIDCTQGTAGAFAAGQLADYGAEVIRVEPPGGDQFQDELNIAYKVYNRSKRLLPLDVKSPGGLATVQALLAGADVFLHSWRPGAAENLELGWDELRNKYPALVYGAISAYGEGDSRPGYEGVIQAESGMMAEQQGFRDGPIYNGLPFASLGAGYLLAIGVAAALYRREQDGRGRRVDTSLFDGALVYLAMMWLSSEVPAFYPRAGMPMRTIAAPYRCSDGTWLGIHTGAVGAFDRCMKAVGLGDHFPASADGLDLGMPLTAEQHRRIREDFPAIIASRSRDEWLETLLSADVCAIPVLEPGAAFDQPQVIHNQMMVKIEDSRLGALTQVGIAAKFSHSPAAVDPPPPGGHGWRSPPTGLPSAASGAPVAPLAGVQVLDLGAYYAGPFGSRLLANLGAEVIKLETPGGDPMRGLDRAFCAAAQGKRSIAVNLKHPRGRHIGAQLAAGADIVTHNMRPGAAERLGLDYASVSAANPQVIYAYSPGWGATGPDANRQGFAPLYSGFTGVMHELAGSGNPPVHPLGNEDTGNGLLGALGMVMALYHRARTGIGQRVEHPQLNATLVHVAHLVRDAGGRVLKDCQLDSDQLGVSPLRRLYPTADGWICLDARREQVAELLRVLGIADQGEIEAAMANTNASQLLELFGGAGICAAIPRTENWQPYLDNPDNLNSGSVLVSTHPRLGMMRELHHFLRLSDSAVPSGRRAPLIGEHSEEILVELGYGDAEIKQLLAERIVRAVDR